MKKNACRSISIPIHKVKSKWIKYLNTNLATLNLIEEKVESSLQCMGIGNYSLITASVAQTLRAPMNKWDLLKLRRFCDAKNSVNKIKRHPIEWVNILPTPDQTKD